MNLWTCKWLQEEHDDDTLVSLSGSMFAWYSLVVDWHSSLDTKPLILSYLDRNICPAWPQYSAWYTSGNIDFRICNALMVGSLMDGVQYILDYEFYSQFIVFLMIFYILHLLNIIFMFRKILCQTKKKQMFFL